MQSRVLRVGARAYKVVNASATTTVVNRGFEELQEVIRIENKGSASIFLKFNSPYNDEIEVAAGQSDMLYLKAKDVFVRSASGTVNFRMIGFRE